MRFSFLFSSTLAHSSRLEWDEKGWLLWEQLAPHCRTLLDLLNTLVPLPEQDEKGSLLWKRIAWRCRTLLDCVRKYVLELQATGMMNALAGWFYNRSEHGEAERLYRRALVINEKSLGPDHLDVAINLNNLADLLRETNRLAEAEPLCRRALAINEAGDQ